MEKIIDANMSKPSDKKEIDRHDSNLYWLTSMKDKIQWFPFLTIMLIKQILKKEEITNLEKLCLV